MNFFLPCLLRILIYGHNTSSLGSSTGSQTRSSSSSSLTPSLCGVPTSKSALGNKIVGGNTSNIEFHPWYAALAKREDNHYIVACGATLITSTHLVTAAHCYDGSSERPETRYLIVFNLQNRCKDEGKLAQAKLVIIHKKYGKGSDLPENDIAMIVLQKAVSNTPICLPSLTSYDGKEALIIGFGSTKVRSADETYPCQLKEAKITIFSRQVCYQSGLGTNVAKKAFCAGKMGGKIDACDGDSGGPLIVKTDNKYELLGVTSYGEGCGRKNLPGVYTDVSMNGQGNWILKRLRDTSSGNFQYGGQQPTPGQQSGSSTGGQTSPQKPSNPSRPIGPIHFDYLLHGFSQFSQSNFIFRPFDINSLPPYWEFLNAIFPSFQPPQMMHFADFMDPTQADMMDFVF